MPVASRDYAVNIRLTAAERERIEAAAILADRKLSDYTRQAVLDRSDADLRAAKRTAKRKDER